MGETALLFTSICNAGDGKAYVYGDDAGWPYYVPIYYYDVEPLDDGYGGNIP